SRSSCTRPTRRVDSTSFRNPPTTSLTTPSRRATCTRRGRRGIRLAVASPPSTRAPRETVRVTRKERDMDEREEDLGAGGEGADEPDTLAGGEFQDELAASSDEVDRETGRYTDGRGAGEGGYAQTE